MVLINDPHFNLHDDNGPLLIRIAISMMVLSFLAMVLRFTARRMVRQPFLMDDWLIPVAVVFAWVSCLFEIIAVKKAKFGQHIELATPSSITLFAKCLYIVQITYAPGIAAMKLSVLLFYHRLFAIPPVKMSLIVLGAITIAWLITMEFMAIFSCIPIDLFWDKEKSGTCIKQADHFLAVAIPNVVTDVVIIFIPIPILWNLKMSISNKIGLIGIFLISGLVVLFSCLRLSTVLQASNNSDITWAFLPHGVFNILEMCIGIVCACLPSMTPLFRFVMGKKVQTKKDNGAALNKPTDPRKYWAGKRGNIAGLSILEETDGSSTWLNHTDNTLDHMNSSLHSKTPAVDLSEIRGPAN